MIPLGAKIHPQLQDFLLEATNEWLSKLRSENSMARDAISLAAVDSISKSIFKKFVPSESRDPSLAENAKRTFLATEKSCKHTNARISLSTRGFHSYADAATLLVASRKIARILGRFSIDEMIDLGRFGPGSTFRCRGSDISKARKFECTDCTPEFEKLARGLLAEYPLWASYLTDSDGAICPMLDPVPGGRYLTVAKDRSTDRSIIVEPTINSWFQQGIGAMIRKRMKSRCAVDLNDPSVNRDLARLGSLTDDLATVDLSSASDLISMKLVEDLLPADWFFWLNATRSHRVEIDGQWVELEKFSSMGNGFTFDLQSLIFYAIVSTITELNSFNPFWVHVFGDDIVVPSGVKDQLINIFGDLGFEINVSKSYFSGPFRESCGKDYFLGHDIRGVYCKRLNTMFDLLVFHNRLFEWSIRTSLSADEVIQIIRDLFDGFRAKTPPLIGDQGLTHHFDEVCPEVADFGWEGFKVRIAVPFFRKEERFGRFLTLSRLQGSQFNQNFIEVRASEGPIGYRYRDTIVPRWE